MSSFRSRARKIAFGDSFDTLSDKARSRSSSSSARSDSSSIFSRNAHRQSSSMSEQCACHSSKKAVLITPKTTNRVPKVNRSQPLETIIEAVEADGCVIVEDFINPQISSRVQTAEKVYVDDEAEFDSEAQSTIVDVNDLIRESLVADPLLQSLASQFLTLETISWKDKQIQINSTAPCISSSTTRNVNSTNSGSDVSPFQRADSIYHTRHHGTSHYEYQSRRDASLGLIVPELNSLSDSVSVTTIPGSHLWGDQKPDLNRGIRTVELGAGQALILLGSLYHKVEQPRPIPSPEKLVHEVWMCSGIYRPAADIVSEDNE